MDFLDELFSRIVPGDGAMGTELMARGVPPDRCFEEACLSAPDLVSAIHADNLAAGARFIETNSFGANAVRLARFGLENRVNEINWTAARLARDAASGKNAYVAGSVGPLGISAEEAKAAGIDREAVFREQLGALLDGGVHAIIFETFLDAEELALALHAKQSLHHCPAIASFACTEEGRLPDGTPLASAWRKLSELGADVVGANCINGPQRMVRLFSKLPAAGAVSVFPNAGRPRYFNGRFLYYTTPNYFAENARLLAAEGAKLIGGCCGIGPAHVRAMVEALREAVPVHAKITVAPLDAHPQKPEPAPGDATILDKIAAGKIVIVTELDTPKTLEMPRFLDGARALIEAGSDTVTLADNSLAILRVSNLAAGAMMKAAGLEPLLHLSCRDRNLLGLQSDLMGMDALGIRHVLALTGDPAKGGDHPEASSVYDINSVELLRLIGRLNEGFNQAGKSLKGRTRFVPGCTFNPNARNLDAQVSRLERKVAAGARYAMTQPVFDPALVKITADRTRHLGIPVLMGIWPLMNGRQAEFLHNEVPGIVVPDAVRARMAGLEGPDGVAAGLEIARSIAGAALEYFPGVYLITPFLRWDLTAGLASWIRDRA